MENPLLHPGTLPHFSSIRPELIAPAIKELIQQNRTATAQLLSANSTYTWENLLGPLDEIGDKLSKVWAPIGHLHSVAENEALREAYNACLPLLTEYHTEIIQNEHLFNAIQSIAHSPEFIKLNPEQQKVIKNEIRDFKIAGVALPQDKKTRLGEIQKQLSKLTTKFAENILDATQGWHLHVTDAAVIEGMPKQDIELAAQSAHQKGLPGWVFTLEFPSYVAVMKYMKDRDLRWLMYEAYTTRASDQGPNAGKWDNGPIMTEILKLRHEMAILLGFPNFATYSLATKMADSPQRVLDFLYDLVAKSKKAAQAEFNELCQFAKQCDSIQTLAAWDIAYYSEKLRQEKYNVSQEELKPYFPADKVIQGMFNVVNKLYGITIKENFDVDVWNPQVSYFEVFDESGELRGSFYTDLYARPHKRDGAWMDECRNRRLRMDGSLQHPVAFLTCNFTRPVGNHPALLTQDEVETLFHEFGHCLHHIMTQINYAAISGINGVAWDAVEFPSQIMEHWCMEKETIDMISSHYQTGEPLPLELFNKILAAKNFQSGMQMVRQLEFSLFDFRIHLEYDPAKDTSIQKILDEVRKQIAVMNYPSFNRFQNSFAHVFAGSYAAGYYSYKWAEVLSSDAFSLFEETGIFNRDTGKKYLQNILEVGGLREPLENFIAFRGREPSIDALLRHSGLTG